MLMLPALRQIPSPNYSSRGGARISKIVCHDCEGSEAGSISWFAQTRSQVSAHLVLSADGNTATQMVAFANKAWHACNFNPSTIGLEMAGYAAKGFDAPEWYAAAGVVAFLLHKYDLPPIWAKGGMGDGFCSHHDLGVVGGGHTDPCDIGAPVWMDFISLVNKAYVLPQPASWGGAALAVPAPAAPSGFTPSATTRHDLAPPSLDWVQMRLNALGYSRLTVDGMMGPNTERAVAAFQSARGLRVDGDPGPNTIAALT